ncbi:hypothetical protein C1H87_13730 [Flavivirga eckloniae]|uniref:Right handed beta helix domain-containing protein n=2 Tax=Flavivirga eckloniae TaxID=1803846 RepID=A0A2K9PRP0_9FLAO|nr:hypothetical protein C1H87_13730 [Flavivirga eckloniae]
MVNCGSDDSDPIDDKQEQEVTIDPNAFYVDKDHTEASDENDGRYVEDGGTGPWKTIQKMLNTLEAGQVGYVKEASTPYIPETITSAFDAVAFFVKRSGTENNPIIIAGYPGERPRIGYNNREEALQHDYHSGFATDHNTSYVTIRNFEISYLTASGVFMNPDVGLTNHNIVLEQLYIHHLYGPDNTGGVRLDGCNNCVVRNSIIHDIYSIKPGQNPFSSEPYLLHSGIHGYQPSNCIIENNKIYNVARAIFQKQAHEGHEKSHVVRNNIIFNANNTALALEIQGAGAAAPRNAEFYNNLVYDCNSAVNVPLQDVGEQGDGLKIYNNTIINTRSIAYTEEMINVEVFNNILSGMRPSWSNNTNPSIVFSTAETVGKYPFVNGISYFDNNLYYNIDENWTLERHGTNRVDLNSLEDWQNTTEPDFGLPNKPDQLSVINDPLFTDAPSRDYTLQSGSPALQGGRGGNYPTVLGAFRADEQIGPDWDVQ